MRRSQLKPGTIVETEQGRRAIITYAEDDTCVVSIIDHAWPFPQIQKHDRRQLTMVPVEYEPAPF